MFFGLLVLVIGVVFLLKNLGYISSSVWDIIWPTIIIIAGLAMIFRSRHKFPPIRPLRKKK